MAARVGRDVSPYARNGTLCRNTAGTGLTANEDARRKASVSVTQRTEVVWAQAPRLRRAKPTPRIPRPIKPNVAGSGTCVIEKVMLSLKQLVGLVQVPSVPAPVPELPSPA